MNGHHAPTCSRSFVNLRASEAATPAPAMLVGRPEPSSRFPSSRFASLINIAVSLIIDEQAPASGSLELIENFASAAATTRAGKLARTDPELDAQIRGLIGNLEDLPEGAPNSRTFAGLSRRLSALGAATRETSALRASNAAMRDQMDTIEMLQTELEKARRETTYARANIKVLNMAGKEKWRLEAAARRGASGSRRRALRVGRWPDMAKSQAERKAELETKLEEERASSAKAREALERLSDDHVHLGSALSREDAIDAANSTPLVAAAEKAAAELKAEFETDARGGARGVRQGARSARARVERRGGRRRSTPRTRSRGGRLREDGDPGESRARWRVFASSWRRRTRRRGTARRRKSSRRRWRRLTDFAVALAARRRARASQT